MLKPTVDNILPVYRAARPEHIVAGLAWYADAHTFALSIANGDLLQGAGVIAALSPQKSWTTNMVLASRAFVEGFASGQTGINNDKATRILNGEAPLAVLGGNKVRNFYANIVSPTGPDVTVDRHAFDIAVGEETDSKTRGQLERKGQYALFADTYRDTARLVGVPPATLQAVTWLVWREAKGLDLD